MVAHRLPVYLKILGFDMGQMLIPPYSGYADGSVLIYGSAMSVLLKGFYMCRSSVYVEVLARTLCHLCKHSGNTIICIDML